MTTRKVAQRRLQRPGVWGSLRFRLSVSVVLVVLTVVAVGMLIDNRREQRVHIARVMSSLQEDAQALRLVRARISDNSVFARFVDDFCANINAHESPGHHILILGPEGRVIARSRQHSGADVEKALLSAESSKDILSVGGHRLAQFRLPDGDSTIIIAQYLDHTEKLLRVQLYSRTATAAATAMAIVVLISLVMSQWVLRPISRLSRAAAAWSARHFEARVEPSGPADLRAVLNEFNGMAQELQRHETDRAAEMKRARRIQSALLPDDLPSVPGLDLVPAYRPVDEVAGDLYDAFELPDGRVAVVLFDVIGHGISAALLTGIVKMAIRYHLGEHDDLSEVVAAVNRDLLSCAPEAEFVTACVSTWDCRLRRWSYCAAGHPGGLLQSAEGMKKLETTGPPLGITDKITWRVAEVTLSAGQRLFLYTDGVTDAGLPDNMLRERGLADLLWGSASSDLADQVSLVMAEVQRRSGGEPKDDVTILGVQVLPFDPSFDPEALDGPQSDSGR